MSAEFTTMGTRERKSQTARLNIRLTADDLERIERRAHGMRVTVSELVRRSALSDRSHTPVPDFDLQGLARALGVINKAMERGDLSESKGQVAIEVLRTAALACNQGEPPP